MKLLKLGIMLLAVFFLSRQAQAQCSNTNLNGVLFYTLSGTIKSGAANVAYQELGKVTADGNGNLVGTTTTSIAGVLASGLPVTGTYSILANCSGTATLITTANTAQLTLQVVNGGGLTLASVTTSGSSELADGRFFRAASATASQCGNGSLQGAYGVLLSGGTFVGGVRTAFDLDGQVIFDGKGGVTTSAVVTTGTSPGVPLAGTGTYSISSDCSGVLQITTPAGTVNYLLARVQGGTGLIMETDAGTTINGNANPQQLQSVLPQFVFGGGWYSALYFSNPTSSTVSFLVTFTTDNGTPMNLPGVGNSKQITLAPLGTAVIEAQNVGSTINQGYASVTLPAGVSGYGVFRQIVAGKPDQEALVGLKSSNTTSSTLTFDDTSPLSSSIAMVNPSTVAATVTITVWDTNGNVIGTSSQGLQPGTKIANSMRAFLGLSGMAGQRGSAQFSVTTGNVAVLGLRFGNTAFTSIPVIEQQ
jgi:hypothetical protein